MFHGESRQRNPTASKRQYTVTFDVGVSGDAEIRDMARYMGTERYTRDPVNGHVSFWVERGVSRSDILRAESFGWMIV
jgi:hypothetical protein